MCIMPEEAEHDEQGNVTRPGGYYAVTQPNTDSDLPWEFLVDRNDPNNWTISFPEHQGAAVWTRPDLARATLAKAMREKLGIRTLAECDDNYLSKPSQNVFMRANNWSKTDRADHLKALFSQDGIVFSTGWLRDFYWKIARKELGFSKRSMPELFVCRNNIDRADWPEPVPREGPLRVGWMGSPSHVVDVNLAWPALMHARNLGCETVMIGYNPADPHASLAVPEGFVVSARSAENVAQWKKVGHRYIPWVRPDEYHRAALPLDIGLCPLLSNHHTLGKSDCKFGEYTFSGAATIAQNNEVYSRTIVHGETGLLVGSPQAMLDAVDLLIKNPRLREDLVANARRYWEEERGVKQMREEWMDAVTG